jgi:hypothetical protein
MQCTGKLSFRLIYCRITACYGDNKKIAGAIDSTPAMQKLDREKKK